MKTAMILAAGRGERLKPLTDKQPKALCLVEKKPLIEHHIDHLSAAGFERIVVNHAYLGSKIRHHLGNGSKWGVEICYTPEPPGGLETGGGIFNALPYLGKKPFVTVNADVFTDFDFRMLKLEDGIMSHLILVENPKHNHSGDFNLISNKILSNDRRYTWAGIAIYNPEAFQSIEIGRYSVVPLIRDLAKQSLATGELYQGIWVDIGSSERLQFANNLVEIKGTEKARRAISVS